MAGKLESKTFTHASVRVVASPFLQMAKSLRAGAIPERSGLLIRGFLRTLKKSRKANAEWVALDSAALRSERRGVQDFVPRSINSIS
jgi:hypothetical protein